FQESSLEIWPSESAREDGGALEGTDPESHSTVMSMLCSGSSESACHERVNARSAPGGRVSTTSQARIDGAAGLSAAHFSADGGLRSARASRNEKPSGT